MNQKILSLLLSLCLLTSVFLITSATAFAETEGMYTYKVENGEATVTGCSYDVSGDITIPGTLGGYPVTTIGNSAFAGRGNLTDVTIPSGVTTIGNSAFAGCGNLTDVTIPSGVTAIGEYAFAGCGNLTDVTIPSGVTTIGNSAFAGCVNLRNIRVAEDNPAYSSENGNLFDKNKTTLIQYAIGKNDVFYQIPSGVTTIGEYAFAICNNLTDVTIPDSVTTIGAKAFGLCEGLAHVTIPNGVTTIGMMAFANCNNLTDVIIPNSVTTIGEFAFDACDNLTNVYYTGSIEEWHENNLGRCSYVNATIHYNWKIPSENNSIILTIGELSANVFGTVKINDVAPQIVNGRTMLPARFVTENLGATVTWSPTAPELVMINKENINIVIYIGSDVAYVNGQQVILDSPAFLENGRTYTPVRFIAEALGAKVGWDQTTQEVTITP